MYVAIDRTTSGDINLLMVSFIWRKRAIPLYWRRLKTLGNSNLPVQKAALKVALSALLAYKIVVPAEQRVLLSRPRSLACKAVSVLLLTAEEVDPHSVPR